jgi:hypothetical protein
MACSEKRLTAELVLGYEATDQDESKANDEK